MKRIIFFIPFIFILGCYATQKSYTPPKPVSKWVWTHPDLYAKADRGEITDDELDHEWTLASSTCNIESLSLQIPSPSCSTIPAPNCDGLTGFSLGLCRGQTPRQECDYSSVNAARQSQKSIYNSCMRVQGWKRVRESLNPIKPTLKKQPKVDPTTAAVNPTQSTQETIDALNQLRAKGIITNDEYRQKIETMLSN